MSFKKTIKPLYLYFIFVAFFLAQVMNGFNGINTFSQTRIFPIIVILIFGWFLKQKTSQKKYGRCASILAIYMCCVAFMQFGISISVISSIISFSFWAIVLKQVQNMRIDKTEISIISLIMAIACNICALTYSYNFARWQYELEHDARVGAVNSIYYILTMLPFVFYLRKWWLSLIMSVIPLFSFIVSGKTTCLLCGTLIISYNIWRNVSKLKWKSKIAFIVTLMCCFIIVANNVDFAIISSDIADDYNSGGNGRSDIAQIVLGMLMQEDNPLLLIFGHGVNSISARIGIGGHNDYLELLFCYGFVGLVIFLGFWRELISKIKWFSFEPQIKTGYVISLIVFFFSTFASKLLATQIGMLSLSLFWGVSYAYKKSTNKIV